MTTPPIQALKDALGAPFPREEINLSDVAAILEALEVAQMDSERLDFVISERTSWYPGRSKLQEDYGILCYGKDRLQAEGATMREAIDAAIALQEGKAA